MEVSGQLHAPVALPSVKGPPSTHWLGSWVGPKAVRSGGGDQEKKFLPLLGMEPR